MTHDFDHRMTQRLRQLQQSNLLRTPRVVETLPGGRCRVDHVDSVNFGGNDYLDIAHDVRVCRAFQDAAAEQTGSTASAIVAGRSPLHDQLESCLARFEDADEALLFPSGYAANTGVLTTLVEANDAVFCDRDNHASIIDAAKTCAGRMLVYHRDRLERLTSALAKRRHEFDQTFIVTDGVFSMDGTLAPLPELCDIADRFDAVVIVDEAHATGVIGSRGHGASEHSDCEARVKVRVGTLSKALGGLGGFAVGDHQTISWLSQRGSQPVLLHGASSGDVRGDAAGRADRVGRTGTTPYPAAAYATCASDNPRTRAADNRRRTGADCSGAGGRRSCGRAVVVETSAAWLVRARYSSADGSAWNSAAENFDFLRSFRRQHRGGADPDPPLAGSRSALLITCRPRTPGIVRGLFIFHPPNVIPRG
ncbi:MAG: aminotransferase class I/II-fold pyridoxal phosphate-dependent enzyme [Planctomycetaceae bacterium]